MAVDDLPYKSIFVLFIGFLIFIAMILNKIHLFYEPLHDYFVLFLFTGIFISITGLFMGIRWNFKHRKPYYLRKKQKKTTHFMSYLAFGIILLLSSFTIIHYYHGLNKTVHLMSQIVSVGGILLLLNGLRYFIKELIIQKTPRHS